MPKLHLFPPTSIIRPGDVVLLGVYSGEPTDGVDIACVSSNPAVATVPAGLAIPGRRLHRNGLKNGEYLARANCLQSRVNCAWFVEVDAGNFVYAQTGASNCYPSVPLVVNARQDTMDRINWQITVMGTKTEAAFQYFRYVFLSSLTPTAFPLLSYEAAIKQLSSYPSIQRLIVTSDGTNMRLYTTNGVTPDGTVAKAFVGTMGGQEFFAIQKQCRFGKMEGGLPSEAQRVAFCDNGTMPAGLIVQYEGGHEILPSIPKFWDTSGNDFDLGAYNITAWPLSGASGDYTDTVAVEPYAALQLTALTPGNTTLTLTRRRPGVPDRASDAEKFEVTTRVITVEANTLTIGPDQVEYSLTWPITFGIRVTCSQDGVVNIASNHSSITVPPTATVSGGYVDIVATAAGPATAIITASRAGCANATCQIQAALPIVTVVHSGPAQSIRTRLP